ncbi:MULTISPECIES: amidohydrolase family protein [unclassified Arthrobacter]|uniref:amidohydrolase family protein n=1 Tax=unclassified Arthrobacter TaxID=235627 RepID=UPI002104BA3C|nr:MULTISPECIES: amidohydrolase family protein [unclassified Arthrobacter]MCQ1946252.1 amidohydrolase family protein [Arthrobacter sp. zg-Y1116]MCQ1986193.1 amidohydrolase family protein [Arthrobacter sp. zg-Y844]MCQ1994068.1 amidohydrolase family protein [Arthrobacter sp. zg-Y1171]UWX81825.1 amidohydrolase family protein [Arthrobacter sp. zg-Y1171]
MRYEYGLDLASLDAIDMHVHIECSDHGHASLPAALTEASAKYFKSEDRSPSLDTIAERYREWRMAAVVFTVDATTALGHEPNSIEEIAEGAARNNDVLIPFGSVDPLQGSRAVDRARMLVEDYGVKGFKFHPSLQGFDPSDQQFYPIYEAISALGVPALFHTGQNGMGAGLPGGYGIKLAYSNPMLLDAVAADFPELQVIMAHPSVPWQDEANSIATHKANVWIDLSGWSPKYFPESLVRASNSMLADKVLFGTDYPLISPQKWLGAFEQQSFKDEVRPKILKDNAVRLLGLDTAAGAAAGAASAGESA